ncbi:MAG: hypothetical protein KGL39_36245 [Patescibacteria group bacterium]|nr:hypothetical protein [Patescibacteria group bacterium]
MRTFGSTPRFTHYGWLGFCPVKIADLDSRAPLIVPRWSVLTPVFWAAEFLESVNIFLNSLVGRSPVWMVLVTRKIDREQR